MNSHPEQLRRRSLASAPGAPWVTYYDKASGGRIELSSTTLANWVAKASGLLAEEYDVGADSVVLVGTGRHWLTHVWTWSVWSLGAAVALPGAEDQADLLVVAKGFPLASGRGRDAPTLVCGSDPFALPLGADTPDGAIDVMADIASYPDVNPTPLPPASSPAVVSAAGVIDGGTAVATAARIPERVGSRILVTADPKTVEGLLACTLSAATMAGATVLAAPDLPAKTRDAIVRQERVDTEIGNL